MPARSNSPRVKPPRVGGGSARSRSPRASFGRGAGVPYRVPRFPRQSPAVRTARGWLHRVFVAGGGGGAGGGGTAGGGAVGVGAVDR